MIKLLANTQSFFNLIPSTYSSIKSQFIQLFVSGVIYRNEFVLLVSFLVAGSLAIAGLKIYNRLASFARNGLSILRKSNQLIFTINNNDGISIVSKGFLSKMDNQNVKLMLKHSLDENGISFHSILNGNLNSSNRVLKFEIESEFHNQEFGVYIAPLSSTPIASKFILIALPLDNNKITKESVSNEDLQEINLSSLLRDFCNDLNKEFPGVTFSFSTQRETSIIKCLKGVNQMFGQLRSEFKAVSFSKMVSSEITCSVHENPYFTSIRFKWQQSNNKSFNISPEFECTMEKMCGRVLYKTAFSGVTEIILLFENSNNGNLEECTLKNIQSIKDVMFINDIFNSIEMFITNRDFSVELLAREVGASRMQLHRKVKTFFNTSPGNLFQFIRMKKAEELLRYDEHKIADVAYTLGYCDQSHFTKAFKAFFGYPPVEYQRIKTA